MPTKFKVWSQRSPSYPGISLQAPSLLSHGRPSLPTYSTLAYHPSDPTVLDDNDVVKVMMMALQSFVSRWRQGLMAEAEISVIFTRDASCSSEEMTAIRSENLMTAIENPELSVYLISILSACTFPKLFRAAPNCSSWYDRQVHAPYWSSNFGHAFVFQHLPGE